MKFSHLIYRTPLYYSKQSESGIKIWSKKYTGFIASRTQYTFSGHFGYTGKSVFVSKWSKITFIF